MLNLIAATFRGKNLVSLNLAKRVHDLKSALTALSYMTDLIEEQPEFFATADGKEFLNSIRVLHLTAVRQELELLRLSLKD